MYKKCLICVNCGRCPMGKQQSAQMQSISKSIFRPPVLKEPLPGKHRLVTVDIGTTTIAMQLLDRMGNCVDNYACVNPQTIYGADVLSRITAAKEPGKAKHMKALVRSSLRKGVERFRALLEPEEDAVLVVAANTTMVYLLMGWDTKELGEAPFRASYLKPFVTYLEECEFPCYVFGGLSAFVGGDIAAGIEAVQMEECDEMTLLIDLGTNGEMVLGNKKRRIACATAAGPAFEGGANRGIWGADMIALTAVLRREGLVDEDGQMVEEYFEKGVRIGDVCITGRQIRELQCAKAAIAAGIHILAEKYPIAYEEIDRVILAGGFGYFLNPQAACEIGLLPRRLMEKTVSGGNTALAGAALVGYELLSGQFTEEEWEEKNWKSTEIVNLALEDDFHAVYVDSMKLIKV